MNDDSTLQHVTAPVDEEHRNREGGAPADAERLRQVEVQFVASG